MKKTVAVVILILVLALSFLVGCELESPPAPHYTMVAPDGAPALAISQLINEHSYFDDIKMTYNVVPASDIQKHIVGDIYPHADFGLLPVNLASKLIGNGDEYKMVGVVTHGNLFFLSKNDTQITLDNAKDMLKGKSIAVVNLPAVPGLTTKAMLAKIGLTYTEDATEKSSENVFLQGINGTEITTSLKKTEDAFDYVIAPEPAVSTITAKEPTIKKVGALHDVYGRYPQAVLVVKTEILQNNLSVVKQIFAIMQGASDYVKANVQLAVDAVKNHLPEGVTSSFKADNTTANSVDGCGINLKTFDDDLLTQVKNYINDIIAIDGSSASVIPETFFVNLDKQK